MCLEDTKIQYSFIKPRNWLEKRNPINAHVEEKVGRTWCLNICVCDSQPLKTGTVSHYPQHLLSLL